MKKKFTKSINKTFSEEDVHMEDLLMVHLVPTLQQMFHQLQGWELLLQCENFCCKEGTLDAVLLQSGNCLM